MSWNACHSSKNKELSAKNHWVIEMKKMYVKYMLYIRHSLFSSRISSTHLKLPSRGVIKKWTYFIFMYIYIYGYMVYEVFSKNFRTKHFKYLNESHSKHFPLISIQRFQCSFHFWKHLCISSKVKASSSSIALRIVSLFS